MGQPVIIEKWAENLEEVTLSEWLKAEGDPVAVGESLCVIITQKVTFEYECQTEGYLCKQYAPEGSTLPVGYVLAWIGEPGEAPATLSGTDSEVVPLLVQHPHRTVVHTNCGVVA